METNNTHTLNSNTNSLDNPYPFLISTFLQISTKSTCAPHNIAPNIMLHIISHNNSISYSLQSIVLNLRHLLWIGGSTFV